MRGLKTISRFIYMFILIGIILIINLGKCNTSSTIDLKIEDISWEPVKPVFTGNLTLYVDVKNIGEATSSDKYRLSVYIDSWLIVVNDPFISPRIDPGQIQGWFFKISDWTVFKEGKHEVKAIIYEQEDNNYTNNEITKTLTILPGNYSIDFNILQYGISKNIDSVKGVVDVSDSYSLNDKYAQCFFYTDLKKDRVHESMGSNLHFRFYSPNGTLHKERNWGYLILFQEAKDDRSIAIFTFPLSINNDYMTRILTGEKTSIIDEGYKAAKNYPGIWRVEVFYGEDLLFIKKFIIGDAKSYTLSNTQQTVTTKLIIKPSFSFKNDTRTVTSTFIESITSISQTQTIDQEQLGYLKGKIAEKYLLILGIIIVAIVISIIILRKRK